MKREVKNTQTIRFIPHLIVVDDDVVQRRVGKRARDGNYTNYSRKEEQVHHQSMSGYENNTQNIHGKVEGGKNDTEKNGNMSASASKLQLSLTLSSV